MTHGWNRNIDVYSIKNIIKNELLKCPETKWLLVLLQEDIIKEIIKDTVRAIFEKSTYLHKDLFLQACEILSNKYLNLRILAREVLEDIENYTVLVNNSLLVPVNQLELLKLLTPDRKILSKFDGLLELREKILDKYAQLLNLYCDDIKSLFLIYVDDGEADRIRYIISNKIGLLQRQYDEVLILHAPSCDTKFINEVKRKIVSCYNNPKIEIIEGEFWKEREIKRFLELGITNSSLKLDVSVIAMPRQLTYTISKVVHKVLSDGQLLNFRCFYVKAEDYTPSDDGYVSHTDGKRPKHNQRGLYFVEVTLSRYKCSKFESLLDLKERIAILPKIPEPLSKKDKKLETEALEIHHILKDQLLLKPNRVFWTDFDSVYSVYYILSYINPEYVVLTGNRVCSIGIGWYASTMEKMNKNVDILAIHVDAKQYSRGVIPGTFQCVYSCP